MEWGVAFIIISDTTLEQGQTYICGQGPEKRHTSERGGKVTEIVTNFYHC